MEKDKKLRRQIIDMLNGEDAHVSLDNALKGIHEKLLGLKPERIPYSIWQLTEHIRITQWDIVEFSSNPKHISPPWPTGYWPKRETPLDNTEWNESLEKIKADRKKMAALISDPGNDLYKPFNHGKGQTLLREALLILDHTSYHTGEIIVIRRLLNTWS
jgi:hypothetical protein